MIVWAFSRLILEDRLREGGGSGGVDIFIGCRIIVVIVVVTPSGKVQMEAVRIHIHGWRIRSGWRYQFFGWQSLSALGCTSTAANDAPLKPPPHTIREEGANMYLSQTEQEKE